MDKNNIAKIGIAAATTGGLGYFIGQQKFKQLLAKSLVITVAPDAPAAIRAVLSNLHVSVKLQDVYDAIDNPNHVSPYTQYFKISLE